MAIMLTGVSVPQSAPKGTLVSVLHWYGSGARRSAGRTPRRRSRASLAGRYRALSPPLRRSRGPPPRTVEQVASPISLRITRVLYLEPLHPRLIWIRKALGGDPLQVVRTHKFEQFAASAGDG